MRWDFLKSANSPKKIIFSLKKVYDDAFLANLSCWVVTADQQGMKIVVKSDKNLTTNVLSQKHSWLSTCAID